MIDGFGKKLAALALAGTLASSQASCGIILHPERSETSRGHLDAVAVVLDCCWLFVGIVPGVVALGVDFASGGAWHPKGSLALSPGQQVELHIGGAAPASCELSLQVLDARGRALGAATRAHVAQGQRAELLAFAIPPRTPHGADLHLTVDGRAQGRWPITSPKNH